MNQEMKVILRLNLYPKLQNVRNLILLKFFNLKINFHRHRVKFHKIRKIRVSQVHRIIRIELFLMRLVRLQIGKKKELLWLNKFYVSKYLL